MPAEIFEQYQFRTIGLVRTAARWRYEAPRQAEFSKYSATIELKPGLGLESALDDLAGFERIWVVFVFHLNATWRPKVSPPYAPEHRKYGVFSTRSPHRPNPIGLSCVELAGIEGLSVRLKHCDILDRTPVLDIKPYIPMVDAFPDSRAGWRDDLHLQEWTLQYTEEVLAQMAWIAEKTGLDLRNFCEVQLRYSPFDTERKRVEAHDGAWTIHCRTWAVDYMARQETHTVFVRKVRSNYDTDDLAMDAPDPYCDKEIHRRFLGVELWK